MRGRNLCSNTPFNNCEEPTECNANLSVPQFKPGDVAWSRINGTSWWPVQVVDEKCVSCKPKRRKNDEVLVRLYGTFEHLYVEPVNCVLKIDNIFGQDNSTCKELFQKTLEEELAHIKSGHLSKKKVSETKEDEEDEAPRGKCRRISLVADSPLVVCSDNLKAAKQIKGVIDNDMDAFKASTDGLAKGDEMKSAELKRITRSKTCEARNAGNSEAEVSNEADNANIGPSMIKCLNKRNSRNSQHKDDQEKLIANIQDKVCESNFVKQNCGWNQNVNENGRIEFSDSRVIKKLVTKIVKEVAAEKVRNEALSGKVVEGYPANTKRMESSRKETFEIKHMKQCSTRRLKDEDIEVHLTIGNIDDASLGKTAGPSDVGKPNVAENVENGISLVKIRRHYNLREKEFDSVNNDRKKINRVDASNSTSSKQGGIGMSNTAEEAKRETHGTYIVNRFKLTRSKGQYLSKIMRDEKSQANVAKHG